MEKGHDRRPVSNQLNKPILRLILEFQFQNMVKEINTDNNKQLVLIIFDPPDPIILPKNIQTKKLINGKYIIIKYINN